MQNSAGAKKASQTLRQERGEDYFARLGARGGKKSKGRKLSAKTKKKISEAMKLRHKEAKDARHTT